MGYGGVYGGVYGSALGYAGYPAYGYRVAAPVVRTVAAPVTTTYTRSYTLPSVYSGYHGLTGYHGLGYAGLYGYGLPIVKTEAAAEAETGFEEARKKREAEADPALFYSSFASPAYGYSYGLHSGYVAPRVYSGYHGLGYAGYPYGYVVKPAEKAADEAVEEA